MGLTVGSADENAAIPSDTVTAGGDGSGDCLHVSYIAVLDGHAIYLEPCPQCSSPKQTIFHRRTFSAPSTEYFPVRQSREKRAAYLAAHGREEEAYERD